MVLRLANKKKTFIYDCTPQSFLFPGALREHKLPNDNCYRNGIAGKLLALRRLGY